MNEIKKSKIPYNELYYWQFAIHEAAHATVARFYGAIVDHVSIDPLPGRCEATGYPDQFSALVVKVAGSIGEAIYDGVKSKKDIISSVFPFWAMAKDGELDETSDFGSIVKMWPELSSTEIRKACKFAIAILRDQRKGWYQLAKNLVKDASFSQNR